MQFPLITITVMLKTFMSWKSILIKFWDLKTFVILEKRVSLIDFVNMLVRNTYPVQFPLIEPSAAISKASSPWAHRHVFSYNRCFLWLWSHNGALKQRFHEVGLLRINNVPTLYVLCTFHCDWLKGVFSKPSGECIVAPNLCFLS